MNKDFAEVIQFVLEGAEAQPIQRRIKLLRGLARICGNEEEEKRLLALADQFEGAEKSCLEFKFSFIQKTKA